MTPSFPLFCWFIVDRVCRLDTSRLHAPQPVSTRRDAKVQVPTERPVILGLTVKLFTIRYPHSIRPGTAYACPIKCQR